MFNFKSIFYCSDVFTEVIFLDKFIALRKKSSNGFIPQSATSIPLGH